MFRESTESCTGPVGSYHNFPKVDTKMLNKWAIAWISFFDNEMHMDVVYKETEFDALLYALKKLITSEEAYVEDEYFASIKTIDELKGRAFDLDGAIGAHRIY